MPRSVFRGTYRPRRILSTGKTLRWSVYLAWRFTLFAGFVEFLLSNKNSTRAVDEFYLADKLSPPALGRDAFCLTAKCYEADGREVPCGRWLWPRSAFKRTYRPRRILLAAKCYEGRYVWRGVLFCLRGSCSFCCQTKTARGRSTSSILQISFLRPRSAATHFALRQNASLVGLSRVAFCFAGGL